MGRFIQFAVGVRNRARCAVVGLGCYALFSLVSSALADSYDIYREAPFTITGYYYYDDSVAQWVCNDTAVNVAYVPIILNGAGVLPDGTFEVVLHVTRPNYADFDIYAEGYYDNGVMHQAYLFDAGQILGDVEYEYSGMCYPCLHEAESTIVATSVTFYPWAGGTPVSYDFLSEKLHVTSDIHDLIDEDCGNTYSAEIIEPLYVFITPETFTTVDAHFHGVVHSECDHDRTLNLVVGGAVASSNTLTAGDDWQQIWYDGTDVSVGTTYQWVLVDGETSYQVGDGIVTGRYIEQHNRSDDFYADDFVFHAVCGPPGSPTPTPTASPSASPSASPTPTATATSSPGATPTTTPGSTPTSTPGGTPVPGTTPEPVEFPTPVMSPTPDVQSKFDEAKEAIEDGLDGGQTMMEGISAECWETASFGMVTVLPTGFNYFNASWPSTMPVPEWVATVRAGLLFLVTVGFWLTAVKSVLALRVSD